MSAPKRAHIWLALVLSATASAKTVERASPEKYVSSVKTLAAPEMQGRGAGTKGLELASEYITKRFKELKLQPAGEKGSYWQSLQVTTGAKLGPNNQVGKLSLNTDYTPLSFSSNGRVS